jgi:hypothetical protein
MLPHVAAHHHEDVQVGAYRRSDVQPEGSFMDAIRDTNNDRGSLNLHLLFPPNDPDQVDPIKRFLFELEFQAGTQCPDVFHFEGRLLPDDLALVPGLALRGVGFGDREGLLSLSAIRDAL